MAGSSVRALSGTLSRVLVGGSYSESNVEALELGSLSVRGAIGGDGTQVIRAHRGWFQVTSLGATYAITEETPRDFSGVRADVLV